MAALPPFSDSTLSTLTVADRWGPGLPRFIIMALYYPEFSIRIYGFSQKEVENYEHFFGEKYQNISSFISVNCW